MMAGKMHGISGLSGVRRNSCRLRLYFSVLPLEKPGVDGDLLIPGVLRVAECAAPPFRGQVGRPDGDAGELSCLRPSLKIRVAGASQVSLRAFRDDGGQWFGPHVGDRPTDPTSIIRAA